MIKIKFNKEDIYREVEFIRTGDNIILKGITEPNESGFTTYRLTGQQLGDFSDYTTVFEINGNLSRIISLPVS